MKRLAKLLAAVLFMTSCLYNNNLLTSGGEDSELPPANPSMVTSIEVFGPVRMINGSEASFTVVTRIGALEVLAVFSPSIDDSSVATVLTDDQDERTVLVKARGPGDATLTVRSGSVEASMDFNVLAASP